MGRAVGRVLLGIGLLLAGTAPDAWSQASVPPSKSMAIPSQEIKTLAAFRQFVWMIYAASAAIGPDARGRTIDQDLGSWVLPEEVRRQLGESNPSDSDPAFQETQRRLTLVGFYWDRQLALRRQRALWLPALENAPAGDAQSSRTRIAALESRLQGDFSPKMTLSALTEEVTALIQAYDQERRRLVDLKGPVHGDVFERAGNLPCTHIVAQDLGTGPNHPIRVVWSPAAMDFYPMAARRNGLTGRVVLQLQTDEAGCVQHMEVVNSSGAPELDDAALDLAARIQFAPAVREGKAVHSDAQIPIVFKLDGGATSDAKPAAPKPSSAAPMAPLTPAPPSLIAGATLTDHLHMAAGYLQISKYDEAIEESNAAIAMDPTSAAAFANRGLGHLWKHEGAKAHDDFESALRLAPDNAVALRGRGVLDYFLGDCDAAHADLTRSLEHDKHSSFALTWRATVDACLSRDSDALSDFAEAEKAAPKNFGAYSERSLLLRALGRPTEALAEVDAMLAVDSEADAQLVAGDMYKELGKTREASAALDRAVSLAPTENSYVGRADDRPPAEIRAQMQDYASALKINPASDPALRGLILTSALAGGEVPEALSAALASREDYTALLGRGIDRWRHGDRKEAARYLSASMRQAKGRKDLNEICWMLGLVDMALDQALEACNRAVEPPLRIAAFFDSRGLVYLRLGRLDKALADYDLALKFRPQGASSLFGRGLVFARLGQPRFAARDREAATRLDAAAAELYQAIGLDRAEEGPRVSER